MHVAEQCFVASHRGKCKTASSRGKAHSAKNVDANDERLKSRCICIYCKVGGHFRRACPRLAANEARKKRVNITVMGASPSNAEFVNIVQDAKWAFHV